ncbi:hypothetical protein AXF42_Ash011437 [Apostasia shenzhenica]|uniref:Uncharacterized protein n=1 Tax=Apostasia shenzhenica TaxID=1088818 RepID=A0A2I0AEH7_9ASPA|nr:hypothetical protein AXF42_Ash011437 [Apostasia shenzhenica]
MAAGNRKLALLTLLAFFLVFAGDGDGAAAAAPFLSFNSSASSSSSSLGEHLQVSEWGLESVFGRRLLQMPTYITYNGALNKNRPAGQPDKPGNAYGRGCQKNYYCKS